jgi:LacI family transcriptional regulator
LVTFPDVAHHAETSVATVALPRQSRRYKEVIGLISTACSGEPQDVETTSLTFNNEILRGVMRRITELGWSLLVTFRSGEAGHDLRDSRWIAAMCGKTDGVLVSNGSLPPGSLKRLARQVPVAVIAGSPTDREVDAVTADNRAGSAAIVTHLVEDHGKQRIYHVDGPLGAPDSEQRWAGLQQVLRGHPAVRLVGTTRGSFSVDSGLAAGQRIIAESRGDLPDAIVAANDQMAIGVLRSFAAAGIQVPDQVAVVGFDGLSFGALCEPPLTTVRQPMRTIGERACALLLERITTPDLPPRLELLPTELVIRQSCGCPRGAKRA